MALQRMRTAAGVLTEIKAEDPSTEVTLHYIRYIIKTGQVPVVCVGRKKLVSVESVIALLEAGAQAVPGEREHPIGHIRQVPV